MPYFDKRVYQNTRLLVTFTIYIFGAILANDGQAQKIVKKAIPDKLVVLTFDDAPASQYSIAAPLLKKYGFNATFFVCEFPNFKDSTKYMTWYQIQQLGLMGFEIANHTQSHPGVSHLSKDQFLKELKYIDDQCDSLKIGKTKTFAYPGYDLDAKTLVILQEQNFLFARAGGDRAYDPKTDHPYLIPSWAMNSENKESIHTAILQAKDGKIVVLTIHGVPDIEHPWVTTTPEVLDEHLKFLYDNHYKVVSLKDLAQYMNIENALSQIKPVFVKK